MYRSKKKASLSLSINAIVILVLAITMLGLGLGFTKGMFSKFASKLEVPPPNIPATPEEPIVLSDESIEFLKNKDFEFSVNFYNDGTGGVNGIEPALRCSTGALANIRTPTDASDTVALAQSVSQVVSSGTFKTFKFIVTAPGIPGKAICTISFKNLDAVPAYTEEKQITLVAK